MPQVVIIYQIMQGCMVNKTQKVNCGCLRTGCCGESWDESDEVTGNWGGGNWMKKGIICTSHHVL